MKTIYAADLFCGAGGTSTGLIQAAESMGAKVELVAVNHWDLAVETHSKNHPAANHLCADMDSINPRKAVPSGKLDILWASPECTHHSNARGGKPMSDQSRATAWCVIRWAEALEIETICIENVREFQNWGPLYPSTHPDEKLRGRPIPERKGETFALWLKTLKGLGYSVEWRELVCANYGDATTRKRFFLIAKKGRRRKISFPLPTHSAPMDANLPLDNQMQTWKPARSIIDWSEKGNSIFGRKKPLADNTMKRILAGLEKFNGARFIVPNFGEAPGQSPRCHALHAPLPTVTGHGAGALIEPYLVVFRGGYDAQPLHLPVHTLTTHDSLALAQPFLVVLRKHIDAQSLDIPIPTLTTGGNMAIAEPYLIEYHGGKDSDRRTRSLDDPIPTQDTSNRLGLCEPYLVKFYEGSDACSLNKPLGTITANYQHFGLVQPELEAGAELRLDILFRMLRPHELAAAHSFPTDYAFAGNRDEVIKQIGNSVPVGTAQAICQSAIWGRH